MNKEELKKKLIDELCEQIKQDAIDGDTTVLAELLGFIPKYNLVQGLPEEEWPKYKDLLTPHEQKDLNL